MFSISKYIQKYTNSLKLTKFPKNGDKWTMPLECLHINKSGIFLKSTAASSNLCCKIKYPDFVIEFLRLDVMDLCTYWPVSISTPAAQPTQLFVPYLSGSNGKPQHLSSQIVFCQALDNSFDNFHSIFRSFPQNPSSAVRPPGQICATHGKVYVPVQFYPFPLNQDRDSKLLRM